ncbi:MAG: LptA/OstA family protein [Longimicrobiales bacterium]
MAARVGLFGVLLLVVIPAVAMAQERSCRQVLKSDARRLFNARGHELIYFRDPVRVLCTGGLILEADSAVMNRTASTVQLVGDVFYQDSLRELTADWANYIGQRSQLLARGSVVLTNLENGSVIEGDELDYLQASETRPVARMIVRGERPYAVIPPQPDSTGELADTAVSTEVWADRMQLEGEEVFRALGNVDLRRGDMTGAGETAIFKQQEERMTLVGGAFVETDRYRLDGERIVASLEGQRIRAVTAEGQARVESEDLTVDSEQVRIGFVDGRLERMEAWNPVPDTVARALADAEGFRLRADSIDARADSIGIQEVRAVGRAYGERDPDSDGAGVDPAIARDWIQGDTILGYFAHRRLDAVRADSVPVMDRMPPDRPGDSMMVETVDRPGGDPATDSTETYLERIVVIGGGAPALSLYRMRAEEPGNPPSINFLKASKIILFMENGDVSRVDADGPLDGVYLAPAGRREEGDGEADEGGGGDTATGAAPETGGRP